MSSVKTVGVVGLKLDEIAAFPKHTYGMSPEAETEVEFYEGNLAEMEKVRHFCADKIAVFAITRNLSTSTLHTLPRQNLYSLGNNIGPKGLEGILEKKYGILKRGESDETPEFLEKIERRYNQPVVKVEEPTDPLGLPETWRSSVLAERVIQARYPNEGVVHKTIPYVHGMREDYGYLKAAHPGSVVRYMRSSNENLVWAEDRAANVVKFWPERIGYMLEAHIHRDFTDYYITQTKVRVTGTERGIVYLRDVVQVRAAMEVWEKVKSAFDNDDDVQHSLASHQGEFEGVVVAVDDDIEVPDSPLSGSSEEPVAKTAEVESDLEFHWGSEWFASITALPEIYMEIKGGAQEFKRIGDRFQYGPMGVAKPGDVFTRPILQVNGAPVGDAVLKMRYPISTYSPKCGYVIEAHAFGDNIFYFVTDVKYDAVKHRDMSQVTDLNSLKTMVAQGFMKKGAAKLGQTELLNEILTLEKDTSVAPIQHNPQLTDAPSKEAELGPLDFELHRHVNPAILPGAIPSPAIARTVDVDFWKQIYALSFGRFGDNAAAREHAQQALDDLNTLE